MDETLNNILLRTLPDAPKKPRNSNRKATKIVANSVRSKKTAISGEQGFRNYIRYTDPLLQESDETTDKSKLADDLEKIINLVSVNKPRPTDISAAKKVADIHIRKEPVSNADVLSEIKPASISSISSASTLVGDRSNLKEAAGSILKKYARAKIDSNDIHNAIKIDRNNKIENDASKKITKLMRNKTSKEKYTYDLMKQTGMLEKVKKNNYYLEKNRDIPEAGLDIRVKPATKKEQSAATTILQAAIKRKPKADKYSSVISARPTNSGEVDKRKLFSGRPKKQKGKKQD